MKRRCRRNASVPEMGAAEGLPVDAHLDGTGSGRGAGPGERSMAARREDGWEVAGGRGAHKGIEEVEREHDEAASRAAHHANLCRRRVRQRQGRPAAASMVTLSLCCFFCEERRSDAWGNNDSEQCRARGL
nr:unnamed protein product [Digitaria exilis]